MKPQPGEAKRRRAAGAAFALTALLGVLVVAFFRVQVVGASAYKLQAETNRLRRLPIPAPRGAVYDRYGRVIADNIPGYAITLIYERKDSARATLGRLQPVLGLDDRAMKKALRTIDAYPGQPLLVDDDANFVAISRLEERRSEFPNVYIDLRPKRHYTSGPAISGVLGYLGEITEQELDDPEFSEDGYEQGMAVGKVGIEKQYEHLLQGQQGVRYLEVDARGRIVGDFAGSIVQPGTQGGSITLSLDLALQEYIDRIFPKSRSGAVVALDPSDGGVLALYSYPTFDPNAFVGGIDPALFAQLNSDPTKPLYNRAVQGLFPPASTFKLVTASIAFQDSVIDGNIRMPVPCNGGISINGVYQRCWKPGGHGSLDLPGAIQNSCNVYFYQLGARIGLDRMLRGGVDIGLTKPCGVDIPGEKTNNFPESRDWWTRRFGYEGREGEVTSLAIGQGPILLTPIKAAQIYMAFARNGTAPAPSLFKGRENPPEGFSFSLKPDQLDILREGMRQVTGMGGTAQMSSLELWDIIGKTGSAENPQSRMGLAEVHSWFIGMAGPWGREPEIVIAVLVEHGGGGSATAAPLAAKAADFYLRKKYGIPVDTIQTYKDHTLAGRPAPWFAADRAALRAAGAAAAAPTPVQNPDTVQPPDTTRRPR
jgi:penicillin-binding protein 2